MFEEERKYIGYKPFPDEPDEHEFEIHGNGAMRVKTHKRSRMNKKWRKQHGYIMKDVTLHGLIVRSPYMGNLNGYIGVPKGNIFYEGELYSRDSSVFDNLRVHGGITFSDYGSNMKKICHFKSMREEYWYIGFDCGHAGDLVPRFVNLNSEIPGLNLNPSFMGTYKDMKYVEKQIRRLGQQVLDPSMIDKIEFNIDDLGLSQMMKMMFGI